jgi:hypothetical protein
MNALDGVGNHPSGRALAGPLPPTPSPSLRPCRVTSVLRSTKQTASHSRPDLMKVGQLRNQEHSQIPRKKSLLRGVEVCEVPPLVERRLP